MHGLEVFFNSIAFSGIEGLVTFGTTEQDPTNSRGLNSLHVVPHQFDGAVLLSDIEKRSTAASLIFQNSDLQAELLREQLVGSGGYFLPAK